MKEEQMAEAIKKAVHEAYYAGYKDGFFDGANKVMDRIEKLRSEYINPDTQKGLL